MKNKKQTPRSTAPRPPRRILITPGDPAGVGPEIVWETLNQPRIQKLCKDITLVCVGAFKPFRQFRPTWRQLHSRQDDFGAYSEKILFLCAPETAAPGKHLGGFQSGWSIQRSAELLLKGQAHALVTGPISKEHLQKGGYPFVGHTDFLAHLCGVKDDFVMMLANRFLKVALVTTHLPLEKVSENITASRLEKTLLKTAEGLRTLWKIKKPKIAVTALNPHAGEGGLLGSQEKEILIPTLKKLQGSHGAHFSLSGPFSADTFFCDFAPRFSADGKTFSIPNPAYDAVVCMYHDQGLIPVKLLDFGRTVNITLGLPFIRTSVDHGTAFERVGKGIADPTSLETALELAIELSETQPEKR